MGEQAELGGGVAALYAHALAIEREALARTPDPHVDWELVFAQR